MRGEPSNRGVNRKSQNGKGKTETEAPHHRSPLPTYRAPRETISVHMPNSTVFLMAPEASSTSVSTEYSTMTAPSKRSAVRKRRMPVVALSYTSRCLVPSRGTARELYVRGTW
mgnify:CR=1 FL=1